MAYQLNKKIPLDKFGWEGCELVFSAITYRELQEYQGKLTNIDPSDPKAAQELFSMMESKFISGTAQNEKNEKVELKPGDLKDLPFEIVVEAAGHLSGATQDPLP